MPAKKTTKKATQNYAGFWIRVAAALIDGVVLGLIQALADMVFPGRMAGSVSLVLSLAYAPVMLYQYQATLGKMALKLKVVPEEGKKLEVSHILLREWVGKFLSVIVFFLGFIWVGFDEKKQGWHDKIARTLVVRE
jgi:uncharacterized RDD family membrane protein YckC